MDVLEICSKMVRDAVSTMSSKFSALVKGEINAKVSSLYKPGGTATLATLPALTADNAGYVYDMSEAFTTTASFREGAGHKYPAGTNVVISDVGGDVYKYDVLSGMLDGYVQESRKIANVPLSADIPVTLTGDTAITVMNTGTASAIGYSVAHNDSGVTAGSKGDTTNQTPGFGGTFKVLSATVDAKGHVTALGDHTVKVPSDTATTSKDGLMSKGDKAKLDNLSVTASNPLEVTKSGETYNVALKDSGVTAGSKGDTTNQTPGFGGTFKVLSATVDAKGRVTNLAEHNVQIPDTEATQSTKGLMSAADKVKLDTLQSLIRRMEIHCTASGNPATFSDADAANIKALSVTITPAQSGSGDPSPSNLRPITGVASVSVTRTGENGTNPQTVAVQLTNGSDPLTVYGGTLDVTTGELTVTHAVVELQTLAIAKLSASPGYEHVFTCTDSALSGTQYPESGVCSHYTRTNADWRQMPYSSFKIITVANMFRVDVCDGRYMEVSDFTAFLTAQKQAGTPVQVLYPLTTPLTYQLTPQQLATLSGYNAVTTNAGSVSVTYKADTALVLGGG